MKTGAGSGRRLTLGAHVEFEIDWATDGGEKWIQTDQD